MSLLSRLLRRFLPGLVDVAIDEVERAVEPEEAFPLSHGAVRHQQEQIAQATSPRAIVPPPRRRR